jgi:hypothetical protein
MSANRPTLQLNFAETQRLDPRFTFTRSTTAPGVDKFGNYYDAAINEPVFDYDPATGECLGLLNAGQTTNHALYSDDFANAAWVKSECSITSNVTSDLYNASNGDKLIASSANAAHSLSQSVTLPTASQEVTLMFVVKAAEFSKCYIYAEQSGGHYFTSGTFDLINGVAQTSGSAALSGVYVSQSITQLKPGVFAVALTGKITGFSSYIVRLNIVNDSGAVNFAGDGVKGIFVLAAMVKLTGALTHFIKTSASAVVQNSAAILLSTNFLSIINPAVGTLVLRAKLSTVNSQSLLLNTLCRLTDNSSNSLSIRAFQLNSGLFTIDVLIGGASITDMTGIDNVTGNVVVAVAYSASRVSLSINGSAVESRALAALPSFTQLVMLESSANIQCSMQYLHYYPVYLSNADLQNLSKL